MQVCTAAATCAELLTSPVTVVQSPPSEAMIAAVSIAASALISSATTLAPSRANNTATALPLPQPRPIEPAPVTNATLPSSRFAIAFPPSLRPILPYRTREDVVASQNHRIYLPGGEKEFGFTQANKAENFLFVAGACSIGISDTAERKQS